MLRARALAVSVCAAACGGAESRPADATGTTDAPGDVGTTEADVVDIGTSSTTDAEDADDGTDGADTTGDPPLPAGPTRYPAERVHSPLTAEVAASLSAIRDAGPALADDVFMKVGASSDASTSNLHCFATDEIDLGAAVHLGATLDLFLAGDAAGTTPFDRDSLAAEAGRSAGWAVDGDVPPVQREIEAISPALAFVHYGTNDMELGTHPGTALPGFHLAMATLLDTLQSQGVVPVLVGMKRRGDDAAADRWVPAYNAVQRAMAQQRKIPFVDVWWAVEPLPDHGLGSDGLHLSAYPGGTCMLAGEGLDYGYNMRNLTQLEALDRIDAALFDGRVDDGDDMPPLEGDGSAAQPWVVDGLPFIHDADTTAGETEFDAYACDDADQSGPELTYVLALAEPTAVRIVALDREGVDVDVHVLADTDSCVARGDHMVATTLDAGTWRIVVDSWSDGAVDYPGRYLLAVVPCDADDPQCA